MTCGAEAIAMSPWIDAGGNKCSIGCDGSNQLYVIGGTWPGCHIKGPTGTPIHIHEWECP